MLGDRKCVSKVLIGFQSSSLLPRGSNSQALRDVIDRATVHTSLAIERICVCVAGAGGFHELLRVRLKCRGKRVLHNKNIQTNKPTDTPAPRATARGSPGMQRRIFLMNL